MRKILFILFMTGFLAKPAELIAQKKIATTVVNRSSITSLSHVFQNYSLFSINTADIWEHAKASKADIIEFELEFPGIPSMRVSLQENNILGNNYQFIAGTLSGKRVMDKPGCITYKGKLANDESSSVYLTITRKIIAGFVKGNGKEYFIEPLKNFKKEANPETFILYEAKDVVPHSGISCGLSAAEQKLKKIPEQVMSANRTTITCKKIEMALVSDESIFIKYGSVADVQDYILTIINNMTGIYMNSQIGSSYLNFVINGLYVSTSEASEPFSPAYNGVEGMTMLTRLSNWGEAGNFGFNYDVCQLWTVEDIVYEYAPETFADVDGLAMDIGTICTPKKYNVVQDWNESLSYMAALSAHEVGHCLGADHDGDFGPYIMGNMYGAPTPVTFSSWSLSSIDSYLSQVTCLSECNASLPPVARFSVSGVTISNGQMQICAESSATFSDNSFGEITGIVWSFQDGTPASSTAENVVVKFNSPGLKTVQLTATNANGSSTTTKTINVIALEVVPEILTASTTSTCGTTKFNLFYTTTDQTARLQWFDQSTGNWETGFFTPLYRFPTLLISPVSGLSFEDFRVVSGGSPCIKISNTIRVNYLPVPNPVISGQSVFCTGNSTLLQVADANSSTPPYLNYLWNPGGETTPSVIVNPVLPTTYSVTITAENGCTATASKNIVTDIESKPVIKTAISNIVCAGTATTISFTGTNIVNGCTNSNLPQWPEYTVNVSACNGNYQLITDVAYAGEYSLVNVETGKYYAFKIMSPSNLLSGDIITISNVAANTIYATGRGLAFWKSTFTGQIRYYSHLENCVRENMSRKKYIACSSSATSFGSFSWMPGGQTTDAITVSPTSSTVYSLTFTNEYGCSATSSINILAGIGAVELSTTNVTCNSATLNWSTPLNPTQWELEYKSTANGSKWIIVPVSNLSNRSAIITGLKLNQDYQWHIRAKCGKTTTPYSDLVLFKTLTSCAPSLSQNRAANNATPENKVVDMAEELKAVAMPNPSNTNFRVAIGGVNNLKDPVKIIVSDMLGRVVETRTVTAGQVILIGDKYRSGTYLLRLTQGNKVNQLKLVKVSD